MSAVTADGICYWFQPTRNPHKIATMYNICDLKSWIYRSGRKAIENNNPMMINTILDLAHIALNALIESNNGLLSILIPTSAGRQAYLYVQEILSVQQIHNTHLNE